MLEQFKLLMANQYFDRRMRNVFVDRTCVEGIESFETYLDYRYRDNCYYYSGYSIMGLKKCDYLVRGEICISEDYIWEKGGYSHGWVEFKVYGEEYVFDSRCKGVVPKAEWYKEFKPKVKFKYSQKEIIESIIPYAQRLKSNCYEVRKIKIADNAYYTTDIYRRGKLFMCKNKVKNFIAYAETSG